MNEITYRPIGIIHSPFKDPRSVPIQSVVAQTVEGTVEIFSEYVEGLQDIEGFSHIFLLYHFHLSKEFSLKVKPYLDDQSRGVFVTRAPSRPNPIGISIVRLLRVRGETLYIRDVDIIDGTPLLDIKPFVPKFDSREVEKIGWLEDKVGRLQKVVDDGRFSKPLNQKHDEM